MGCSTIGGVISPLMRVITIVILLITPLTTHEPPSRTIGRLSFHGQLLPEHLGSSLNQGPFVL